MIFDLLPISDCPRWSVFLFLATSSGVHAIVPLAIWVSFLRGIPDLVFASSVDALVMSQSSLPIFHF